MFKRMPYPVIFGRLSNGREVEIETGAIGIGHTLLGRVIRGVVIATHPYYPSVTLQGHTIDSGPRETLRADIHVSALISVLAPDEQSDAQSMWVSEVFGQ